jgi:uncharacterized protein (DUF2236 family)
MMTTQSGSRKLCSMARVFQANTGKLPTTVKELADYWYKIRQELCGDGREPKADATAHVAECNWLFQIAERPAGDVLLALALRPLRRSAAPETTQAQASQHDQKP